MIYTINPRVSVCLVVHHTIQLHYQYCAVLYYVILYYIIVYCAILDRFILHCTLF